MIILPSPPKPLILESTAGVPDSRLALCLNHASPINYAGLLEDYANDLFAQYPLDASRREVWAPRVPWTGVERGAGTEWLVNDELSQVLGLLALVYSQIAGNAMVGVLEAPATAAEAWKRVSGYYKRALGFLLFALTLGPVGDIPFLQHLTTAALQLAVLAKALAPAPSVALPLNNGMYARVATFVLGELQVCERLMPTGRSDWLKYVGRTKLLTKAYAGYFCSQERYHQNAIGEALGLAQYGLHHLEQTKSRVEDLGSLKGKLQTKLQTKLLLLAKLQASKDKTTAKTIHTLTAVSVLNKESVLFFTKHFTADSAMMAEVRRLHQRLVEVQATCLSENRMLSFQAVPTFEEVEANGQVYWPAARPVPVTVETWVPCAAQSSNDYLGRGAYY